MIYRNYFGTWGRELSDGDFACALAALGVIDARRYTLRLDDRPFDDLKLAESELIHPLPWSFPRARFGFRELEPDQSAETLMTMWKQSSLPGSARLEVDRSSRIERVDSVAMLTWIVSALSRKEVNARSVYLRVDRPSVTVGWQWPMRIGFLADEDSQSLKTAADNMLAGDDRLRPLAHSVNVEEKNSCDLLLLPWDLRESLARAAAIQSEVRADCTIVLGRASGDAGHWYRMVDGLRAALRTSGVAIANHGIDDAAEWLQNVIVELSHNAPIDAALFSSTKSPARAPFIAISRRLADFSRVAMQMRRAARSMRRPPVREVAAEMTGAAEETMRGTGMHSLDHVADAFDRAADAADAQIRSGSFEHETGGATGAAMARRSADMAVTAAAPSPALEEERFIQAQVFDVTTPNEPRPLRHRFRRGAHHEIKMRVGAPDAEWISTASGPAFPVDALPQDQDEWELTAVLSIAQSDDDPQITTFNLPRFGNSSEASFFLFVQEKWEAVEARIVVLHRNRVIQTAMLEGKVGAHDDGDERISVNPEVIAKTHLETLDTRERFAASLVINKSKSGVDRLLAISDDKVAKFTPAEAMTRAIEDIDDILTEVTNKPKDFMGKLDSASTVDLLRRLARKGNLLFNSLIPDSGLAAKFDLDKNGPLQVVTAVPGKRLPIEFVYSRKSPSENAELCPNSAAALRKGKCDEACRKPANEKKYICPLAFWGMQRVIERHAFSPELADVAGTRDFAVVSEPTALRPSLDLLTGGIVGGSQKVEDAVAGGLEDICTLVGKFTGSNLKPVKTWNQWVTDIKKGPSLLLLIVHTEETDDNEPKMEIGKKSWLEVGDIENEHVIRKNGNPPLVLLIGCETGVSDRQFGDFVSRLRVKGAAIVVATGAKVHSIHAVPVAKEFVNRIQEASKKSDASFGEIMLKVRREMLADGIPMVLTLNAYGDADWRLAKHS